MTIQQLSATRVIEASVEQVFDLLADPRRHHELDGSAMVRGDVAAEAVTGVGQVFRMRVHHPAAGDYRTDNHVSRFEAPHLIAWMTSEVDADPAGWEWIWRLESVSQPSTRVTVTYDWSGVTDPQVLALVQFPVVSQQALEASLDRLAAAAA